MASELKSKIIDRFFPKFDEAALSDVSLEADDVAEEWEIKNLTESLPDEAPEIEFSADT